VDIALRAGTDKKIQAKAKTARYGLDREAKNSSGYLGIVGRKPAKGGLYFRTDTGRGGLSRRVPPIRLKGKETENKRKLVTRSMTNRTTHPSEASAEGLIKNPRRKRNWGSNTSRAGP